MSTRLHAGWCANLRGIGDCDCESEAAPITHASPETQAAVQAMTAKWPPGDDPLLLVRLHAPWHWGPDESDGDYALLGGDNHNIMHAAQAGVDVHVQIEAARELIADAWQLPRLRALLNEVLAGVDAGRISMTKGQENRIRAAVTR